MRGIVREDEDRRLNAQIEAQMRKDMESRAKAAAIKEEHRKGMTPPTYLQDATDSQKKVIVPGSA